MRFSAVLLANIRHLSPLAYGRLGARLSLSHLSSFRGPPQFFGQQIKTDTGPVDTLDKALILPGLGGKRVIETVRRVLVPSAARVRAARILATLDNPPPVVSIDTLRT